MNTECKLFSVRYCISILILHPCTYPLSHPLISPLRTPCPVPLCSPLRTTCPVLLISPLRTPCPVPLISLPRLTSQILVELLKTYSSADASESAQLAQQLIVLVISDPNQFVFDHLLSLEPVAALSSQRIYQVRLIQNVFTCMYFA